ncbi:hypothetical protein HMI54_003731 [Coelomomyces lativittatus]|nr:hypothetical protein HMI54_003731 [Coelomomyces lativittatus]KAJ1508226.1 hypothetical protein HMI56_007389 [Coelomomyces lativittatus]KAJ1511457.1 hypothetical protein HMI55_006585 [Coelomomyces lativittatus]
MSASVPSSLTSHPVFRSWILWSCLGLGTTYGFFRQSILEKKEAKLKDQLEKQHLQEVFLEARRQYEQLQQPTLNKEQTMVLNPDDPHFNFDTALNHVLNQ